MVLPKQSSIELPLLKVISDNGGQLPMLESVEKVTTYFKEITEKDLIEKLESGSNRWRNCVQWVRQKLISSEELDGSSRGIWKITEKGVSRLRKEWSSWKPQYSESKIIPEKITKTEQLEFLEINPIEKISNATKEINDSISNEILANLRKIKPSIF